MRKQYGLKFEESFIDQVDRAAAEMGVTRTVLFEQATERFLASPPMPDSLPITSTRATVRVAFICERCAPPRPRVFGREGDRPKCATHGFMTRQINVKYNGQPT